VKEQYRNPLGKLRPSDSDSENQSSLRKLWFERFESKLRQKHPKLFEGVKLRVVGSVVRGEASSKSDIDIIIVSKSSDETLIPKIRHAISSLLMQMKYAGEIVYEIDIQDVSYSSLFSVVSLFHKK